MEAHAVWLEQLRAFFIQAGIASADSDSQTRAPIRVIEFKSQHDFAAVRPAQSADAFFLGDTPRDYLVLSNMQSGQSGILAHEYTHLVLHSIGMELPVWLAEGLSEVFSTVRISNSASLIGGDLPVRRAALQKDRWMPLSSLLSVDSAARLDRDTASIFYAESWALTDMLIFSPKYGTRLPQLMGEMASRDKGAELLARVAGAPLAVLEADLHAWLSHSYAPIPLPGISSLNLAIHSEPVSDFKYRLMMADLFLESGRLGEAETAYRALKAKEPANAEIHGALGLIALRQNKRDLARQEWKRSIDLGIRNPDICYRYAELAEDAHVPAAEIRAALSQALELEPGFDDARFKLALLESHSNNYAEAVKQLRAMGSVPPARAYGYWMLIANALLEMDVRDEAKAAADYAAHYASTDEERHAASLASYMAETDLTVQLTHDAQGNLEVVTARKPHGSDDWNPFVEAGDQMRHFEGQIRKVQCTEDKITGFQVASATQAVNVSVPDPTHVLILGGTPEFICGQDDGRAVAIDFAAVSGQGPSAGLLRGMRFQ